MPEPTREELDRQIEEKKREIARLEQQKANLPAGGTGSTIDSLREIPSHE